MNFTPQDASIGKIDFKGYTTPSINTFLDKMDAEKAEALPDVIPGELSNAFAMLDPDLAELFKELQLATLQLSEAKKSGQKASIAKWRFETAESAYQTRLYEVRKNSLIKEIESGNEDKAVKKELHGLTMQQRMNEEFAMIRKKRQEEKRRKEEKSNGGFFFYFMIGFVLSQMAEQNRQRLETSTLQNHFSRVKTA